VGLALADARAVKLDALGGNPQVRIDAAAFLGEPDLIHDAHLPVLKMARHATDSGKRGDAQPADAGHEDVVAVWAHGWQRGVRQLALLVRDRRPTLRLAAVDRDEARAKSLNAGEILVASRLIDLALSPEFRLKRLYGETVGGAGTVAATFANTCVNNGPGRRLFQQAALAAAAFFGRANLIVDDNADAGRTAQLALHRVQPRAGMKRRSGRDIG